MESNSTNVVVAVLCQKYKLSLKNTYFSSAKYKLMTQLKYKGRT